MKYIGFKHQRKNKQNSDKCNYCNSLIVLPTFCIYLTSLWLTAYYVHVTCGIPKLRGWRCRDRKVVEFTTTYAKSVYHHYHCELESISFSDEVYSIQHYVIKFVNDLRWSSFFLRVLRFPPAIKFTGHDITEILLKVALNTINQTRPLIVQNRE